MPGSSAIHPPQVEGQRMKSLNGRLDKLALARAQLGTATYLFLHDLDPVSVQCLACAGGEIIDALARKADVRPSSAHIIATRPDMDMKAVRAARNKYWNAFKHLTSLEGVERSDDALLASFDDSVNDTALFVAWTDYGQLTGKLPVAAQSIQLWWYCLHTDRIAKGSTFSPNAFFPRISEYSRNAQKAMLRAAVAKYERDAGILSHPATEVWPPIPTRAERF